MPTEPNGALGSLDYKKEERRALAIKSREAAPKFGTPDRQKLMDEVNVFFIFLLPTSVLSILELLISVGSHWETGNAQDSPINHELEPFQFASMF